MNVTKAQPISQVSVSTGTQAFQKTPAPTQAVEGVKPATEAAPVETNKPAPDERLVHMERVRRQQARELSTLKTELAKLQGQIAAQTKPSLTQDDVRKQFLEKGPEALGMTWDDFAKIATAAPTAEQQELNALRKEIAELRDGQKQTQESINDQQKKAYDQAIKQVSREVESLIKTNDAFEMIKSTKNEAAVTALIELTYKEEGTLMSVEEACQEVENYLVDETLARLDNKKIKSRLEQQSAQQQQTQQTTTPVLETKPKATLTNDLSSSSTTLTAKQKRERAIAAFQGRLK